jgi:DNA-binding FadR family transcriptional regulator
MYEMYFNGERGTKTHKRRRTMTEKTNKISAIADNMDISELLEARRIIETRLARLALKSVSPDILEEIDSDDNLKSVDSLAAKAGLI